MDSTFLTLPSITAQFTILWFPYSTFPSETNFSKMSFPYSPSKLSLPPKPGLKIIFLFTGCKKISYIQHIQIYYFCHLRSKIVSRY